MAKRHRVELTPEEREELKALVSKGESSALKQTRARILLMCDESEGRKWTNAEVASALSAGTATVERVRRRFAGEGLEAALNRKSQKRHKARVLDGEAEARLVAVACGDPPEGRAKWTLRLLADRLVELEVVESVCPETVRRALKKPSQAVAEGQLVHSAEGGRGLRRGDGGRAGRLPAGVRRGRGAGVHGRNQQAADQGDAGRRSRRSRRRLRPRRGRRCATTTNTNATA